MFVISCFSYYCTHRCFIWLIMNKVIFYPKLVKKNTTIFLAYPVFILLKVLEKFKIYEFSKKAHQKEW